MKRSIFSILLLTWCFSTFAQDIEDFQGLDFDSFVDETNNQFEDFRNQCNAEYAVDIVGRMYVSSFEKMNNEYNKELILVHKFLQEKHKQFRENNQIKAMTTEENTHTQ